MLKQPGEQLLSGKALVVTGAGNGIGAACAMAVALEGAQVIVNDIDSHAAGRVTQEICATGGVAVAHPCDITSNDAAGTLIARCVDEFGGIDGLVNNAGVIRNAAIDDVIESDIRAMVSVNILGTIFCGHHAIRAMRKGSGGAIVNVGSAAQNGMSHLAIYCATKGAVASLTYAWAAELAGCGIRVNAILPYAATGMMTDMTAYRADRLALFSHEPALPPAPPAAVNAPAVIYLLSDLSAALNGSAIQIMGNDISLMGRTEPIGPTMSNPAWSAHSIAAALAGQQWGARAPHPAKPDQANVSFDLRNPISSILTTSAGL